MDSTAFSLCMDNKMPIIVFDFFKPHNLRRVVMGEKVGTLVVDSSINCRFQHRPCPNFRKLKFSRGICVRCCVAKPFAAWKSRREKVLRPTSLKKFQRNFAGRKIHGFVAARKISFVHAAREKIPEDNSVARPSGNDRHGCFSRRKIARCQNTPPSFLIWAR